MTLVYLGLMLWIVLCAMSWFVDRSAVWFCHSVLVVVALAVFLLTGVRP